MPHTSLLATAALMTLAASAATASATPTELTIFPFTLATAGLPAVVETFEGFAPGNRPSPLTLSNGTYTSSDPNIADNTVECGAGDTGHCLNNSEIEGNRTFSAFPANTDFWATDFFAISPTGVFQVTVTGGSGTAVFTRAGGNFWGFGDLAGLTSVTFTNQGRADGSFSNYSFDNVTTVTGPARTVPEPASLALLGTVTAGLLGFAARRRKVA